MAEKKKRRSLGPKVSQEVLRAVFYDVKHSKLTLNQIAVKYKISSGAVISKWIKKYSSDFEQMNNIPSSHSGYSFETTSNHSAGNQKLQKELEEAKMKIICLETMIDIAEQELNVNIRKKPGAKQ